MNIPLRIQDIAPAIMDEIGARVKELTDHGADVVNLAGGAPSFPPVASALRAARQAIEDPGTHLYGADAGLLSLREGLSRRLAENDGINVDPATEIMVTAGANQAFMLAVLTLLEPGDKVLLPSPFYFNHEMTVRIAGGVPVEVPLREETGFQLTLADLEPYLDTEPRMLVVVSPNNPTGAVFDPEELQRIARHLSSRGIVVISDETYRHFVFGGARHFSVGSLPECRSQVITIGSFSKTFSLSGWRVGYLVAEADFVQQAIKVQDSMLVCAPLISQRAALGALSTPAEELARRRAVVSELNQLLARSLADIPRLQWHPTQGAYYAFVRVEDCTDSAALATDLLETAQVAAVPGSVYGHNGEGFLRLSYGSASKIELEEACARLSKYFAAC
jgi:aminotransferase